MYTQGKIRIFSEPLLRFAFVRLVQDHLKAPNNHRFSSLLYFLDSLQLRFFSTIQPWVVWCEVSAQSGVTSSSSSAGPLRFLESKYSLVDIFPDVHGNPRGPASRLRVARAHASCLACHPRNLRGTSAEEIPTLGLL